MHLRRISFGKQAVSKKINDFQYFSDNVHDHGLEYLREMGYKSKMSNVDVKLEESSCDTFICI